MELHDEQLKHFFSPSKHIRPRERFQEESLRTILSHELRPASFMRSAQRQFWGNLTLGFALGLTAIFVFFAFGGKTNLLHLIPGSAERNESELLSEAASLDFQIELGEAEYFGTQSAEEVALMIQTINDDGAVAEAGMMMLRK